MLGSVDLPCPLQRNPVAAEWPHRITLNQRRFRLPQPVFHSLCPCHSRFLRKAHVFARSSSPVLIERLISDLAASARPRCSAVASPLLASACARRTGAARGLGSLVDARRSSGTAVTRRKGSGTPQRRDLLLADPELLCLSPVGTIAQVNLTMDLVLLSSAGANLSYGKSLAARSLSGLDLHQKLLLARNRRATLNRGGHRRKNRMVVTRAATAEAGAPPVGDMGMESEAPREMKERRGLRGRATLQH